MSYTSSLKETGSCNHRLPSSSSVLIPTLSLTRLYPNILECWANIVLQITWHFFWKAWGTSQIFFHPLITIDSHSQKALPENSYQECSCQPRHTLAFKAQDQTLTFWLGRRPTVPHLQPTNTRDWEGAGGAGLPKTSFTIPGSLQFVFSILSPQHTLRLSQAATVFRFCNSAI